MTTPSRRAVATASLAVALLLGGAPLLAGCRGSDPAPSAPIPAAPAAPPAPPAAPAPAPPPTPPPAEPAPRSPFAPPDLDDAAFLAALDRSVVRLEILDGEGAVTGAGASFFVERNRIATCRHVVEHAQAARIRFASGREFPVAGQVGEDVDHDLCLLAVETPGVEPVPLPLGAEAPAPGDRLVAVGPPLPGDSHCLASYGRALPALPEGVAGPEELRIRMPLAPGWSGSPVLSAEGEVVGVARGGFDPAFALAAPARRLAATLSRTGYRRPTPLQAIAPRGPFGRPEEARPEARILPFRFHPAAAARFRGDIDGALDLVRKILEANPGDADGWRILGDLLGERGRTTESIAALRKACDLTPGYAPGFALLGSRLLEAELHSDALDPLREAVRLDPTDRDSTYSLGYSLMRLGEFEEALGEYRRVLELDPTYTAAKQGVDYCRAMLPSRR